MRICKKSKRHDRALSCANALFKSSKIIIAAVRRLFHWDHKTHLGEPCGFSRDIHRDETAAVSEMAAVKRGASLDAQ
jgi:hypothetical protein